MTAHLTERVLTVIGLGAVAVCVRSWLAIRDWRARWAR